MAEFMKKGPFGYKPAQGGEQNPEYTHVILSQWEYSRMLQEKAQAEQAARDSKQESARAVSLAREAARRDIETSQAMAAEQISEVEEQARRLKQEIEYQRNLNENLLRICKERANADRRFKPKKEHSGYAVISSGEKEYRYRAGRVWNTVTLWETTLQGPYTVEFTAEQARKQMLEDLLRKREGAGPLIRTLGITARHGDRYERMMESDKWNSEQVQTAHNIMLEDRMRIRWEYWEITFSHTKPLSAVPPELRAKRPGGAAERRKTGEENQAPE